ncbi:hypothetical protein L6452_30206 [Arctium lappa]|uniref:Uncharacterized protein n=1 Tax=Arctium lappa TaxID=4217 RepID=A0ACB8ZHW9_ARCLA|nr:hypothetical protein L6452_30206 [Arctium lappa]
MAVQLPDELIVEILSFLPAKSLLRCRLVCKSWLSLINSTKFKLMHLHNFNHLNPRYLVRSLDYCVSKECLDTIILWNPSIRRKLTLPMLHSVEFEESFAVLGFGYDKISDDYKVVRLNYVSNSFIRPQVEVYTVKTGIWREVMFPDNLRCFYIYSDSSRVFSNGSVHWIASDRTPGVSHYSILTFDISTELFGEIQVPEFLAKEFLMVFTVGESLAVIHPCDLNFDGLKSGSTYLAMVMKEYKNPASWTMMYYMHYSELNLGKPLRLRNNGDMIVELENRDMVIFNHNEGYCVYAFRDGVEDKDFDCRTFVDRYQESLALLDVGDSVPNNEAMEALMKVEKQGMMNLIHCLVDEMK